MTLIRFYKPYGVLSQFRDPARPTLGDYIDRPGVYPAGRLDRDSEGLLLLTDDGALQARIAEPRHRLAKFYWAQVEARPDAAQIAALAKTLAAGVTLGDGSARALSLRALPPPPLPFREPPVTPHRAARSSWLEVTVDSGRNRLVRRLLAAVGLPVLRLHRPRIGEIDLQGLTPGQWQEVEAPPAWQTALRPRRPRLRSGRPARR